MTNGDIKIEQAASLMRGRPAEEQLALIYVAIENQRDDLNIFKKEVACKFIKIERRKYFDKVLAIVAGVCAALGIKLTT